MNPRPSPDVRAGQAVYSKFVLATYDLVVMKGNLPFAWKCSVSNLLDLYNSHVSSNHLECGVGTGYFLDHCRSLGRLVLLDLNPNSLDVAARRLRRYRPGIYRRNVLESFDIEESRFDSIGMNFLLHCLPGDIHSKSVIFDHVSAYLNPGGCLFGSTVLCGGVPSGVLGRVLTGVFNRTRIFSNRNDDLAGLRQELGRRFPQSDVRTVGSVGLFWARK